MDIEVLLGILTAYEFVSDFSYGRLGLLSILVLLGGYCIYNLWKTTIREQEILKQYSVYPYIKTGGDLKFALIILYMILFIAIISLFFVKYVGAYFIFLSFLVSIINLIILRILSYKKQIGIYGIAVNLEKIRVATSSFCYLFLLSDISNALIDEKHLYLHIEDETVPSPIKIQLSMLAEDNKYALLSKLEIVGIQLKIKKS